MTDDLVKRLRDFTCDCFTGNSKHMTWEAADRIEELEKQITELASVIEELVDKDAADRIELLEAALVVFAKRSEWYDEGEPDNLSDWDKEAKPRITIKDLRRARAALDNKNDR
jgi:hypothetical protein